MDKNPNQPADTTEASQETPAAPVNATPEASTTPASPAPAGNDKKKLFILLGSIAGVIVLAIIGLVMYLSMNSVSKADYRAAATQYNKLSTASRQFSSDVRGVVSSMDETEAVFTENLNDARESLKTVEAENKALGDLKASRVGEGGKLYKDVNDKINAYSKRAENLFTSIESIQPALSDCSSTATASQDDRTAALKSCVDSLNKVGDVPDEDFKKFVEVMKMQYGKLAVTTEKMAAITDPYGDQYDEYRQLRADALKIQSELRTQIRELTNDIEKADEAVSPNDALKAYADYINEQQRK